MHVSVLPITYVFNDVSKIKENVKKMFEVRT